METETQLVYNNQQAIRKSIVAIGTVVYVSEASQFANNLQHE